MCITLMGKLLQIEFDQDSTSTESISSNRMQIPVQYEKKLF